MAYKKSWSDLPDVPTRCPVCHDKRTDADAVKIHNTKAATDGCRSYPVRRS